MWQEVGENITVIAAVIYGSLILVELTLNWRSKAGLYTLKDTLCSLTMGGFYTVTKLLMKGTTLFLLLLAQEFALFDFGVSWYAFIAAYVVTDFFFYWLHRFIHEIRFGWAAHVNHHSSEEFNLGGTALRQSFAEPFMEALFYSPIVLLGFDPFMVLAALELNLIYMFWIHTKSIGKLPRPVEWLLSTPSHHRVHHASNVQYLDKNYGGTFIIWDRLFGSFAQEQEAPIFGIPDQIKTFNPIKASVHGWIELLADMRATKGAVNKFLYCVMPPGWAPNGTGQTTRQKQAAYRIANNKN
ncbi:MAG: sterol desaturase/sphingolipid hydroxylase (fatty acid hydroxylase superfamily) [Halioglobus sp.]|jgi:sterol desaturase/sphingolipid hydroxylase (fatty acid hydroxylase superfamily)